MSNVYFEIVGVIGAVEEGLERHLLMDGCRPPYISKVDGYEAAASEDGEEDNVIV